MIPKSIRRTITVGNDEWEYCVTGRWSKKVFLHNLKTNEKINWHIEGGYMIEPKEIRTLIETKKLFCVDAR